MHHQSTQNQAKELYLGSAKTQTEIAAQLGVHQKTIAYWVKQKNWKQLKTEVQVAPAFISLSILTQLLDFQGTIMSREEGDRAPTLDEVQIQCKLIAALSKFPLPAPDDMETLFRNYSDPGPKPGEKLPTDKKPSQSIDKQMLSENEKDKKEIKTVAPALSIPTENNNETQTVHNTTSPTQEAPLTIRKNVVLRSGVRWIEKGIAYDPSLRGNRKLTKPEYDELIRKGLTKADFQGWSPS